MQLASGKQISLSRPSVEQHSTASRVSLAFNVQIGGVTLTTSSSPSTSRVEGSGMGPSMTHRFDSYFVRIKFSILASEGMCPGASFASQYLCLSASCPLVYLSNPYLFARALPHRSMLANCSSVHVSRSTDLTRLMCVPIPRWIPEHLWSPLSADSQQSSPSLRLLSRTECT